MRFENTNRVPAPQDDRGAGLLKTRVDVFVQQRADLCARFFNDPTTKLSRSLQVAEHVPAQDLVGSGLVSLAGLLEPGYDIGVEAHRNRQFYRPIESAANRLLPRSRWEFRKIRGIDLVVVERGQRGEVFPLLRSAIG